MRRVLVVDDKASMLDLLRKILGERFEVVTAGDGTRALGLLASTDFDVVLSDIRMPGADGHTILREARRMQPDVEVILMTAFGTVASAVGAMKEGAFHYLTKPFDPDEALLLVERAAERRELRVLARDLGTGRVRPGGFHGLVGRSAAMARVVDLAERAARTDVTVLLLGESGTGKDLLARAIHAESGRRDRRFVPVNCGAIPETLLESELFGHARGAFTGATSETRGLVEEANGGTLFLDEVGDLPLPMQVKLNRALQERTVRRVGETEERPVDVRVLAATNVDLREAVRDGRFRSDLYFRLAVFPIRLPPLRDRREDVSVLAESLLARRPRPGGEPLHGFTAEALSALVAYAWPGNVRELENAIERAVAVTDGPRIALGDLPEEVVREAGRARPPAAATGYREAIALAHDRAAREYLTEVLTETRGHVTRAAERAGLGRETLHRLLRRHGLRAEDFRTTE